MEKRSEGKEEKKERRSRDVQLSESYRLPYGHLDVWEEDPS